YPRPLTPRLASFLAVVAVGAGHHAFGHRFRAGANGPFQLGHQLGIVLEELLGVLAALADAHRIVGEPGTRFLDHAGLHAQIENFADLGNALAIHDVELDLLERGRDLILHHLHARRVADDV